MIFNLFTALIVGSVLLATQARRPIYGILSLIVTFVLVAYTLLWLRKDFLALAFIIVYVGAIATLFLFIVMMIDFRDLPTGKDNTLEQSEFELLSFWNKSLMYLWACFVFYFNRSWKGVWLALKTMSFSIFFIFILPSLSLFVHNYVTTGNVFTFDEFFATYGLGVLNNAPFYENDLFIQGSLMYTQHFASFMVIGLILFTAMLGAIALVVPSSVMKRSGY